MAQEPMDKEFNQKLDMLIESRRTIRSFTDEVPPKESLEQIVKAGLLAPYAPPAVAGERLFRRFFVIEGGSSAMGKISEMAVAAMRTSLEGMKKRCEADPAAAEKAAGFIKRLEMIAEAGQVPMKGAPYYIVIAEKKGIPPVEMESLAHCIQNMYLKATALGLGLRLVSMTAALGAMPEFCELLGIPFGEFGFNGCTVGYATEWPPAPEKPGLDEVITWLE